MSMLMAAATVGVVVMMVVVTTFPLPFPFPPSSDVCPPAPPSSFFSPFFTCACCVYICFGSHFWGLSSQV